MNPKLELHGTSVIRDYTVRVYVYGTMLSPEAIFTSEPPLAQEEIISLIATGATRQELSIRQRPGWPGGDVTGSATLPENRQEGRANRKQQFFNRLDLDLGRLTHERVISKLTCGSKSSDHFVLIGDVGVRRRFSRQTKISDSVSLGALRCSAASFSLLEAWPLRLKSQRKRSRRCAARRTTKSTASRCERAGKRAKRQASSNFVASRLSRKRVTRALKEEITTVEQFGLSPARERRSGLFRGSFLSKTWLCEGECPLHDRIN